MGEIRDKFAEAYRDSVNEGIPASGAHEPLKRDIRALALPIEAQIAAAALSGTDLAAATALVEPIKLSAQAAQAAAEDANEAAQQAAINVPTAVAAQLAGAVNTATSLAAASASQSAASRNASQDAAEQSSLSAAAASAAGPFASTAAGLAASAEGAAFLVQGEGGTYATLYRKTGGAAVAQDLSIASLAGVQDAAQLAATIAANRPVLRRDTEGARHSLATQFNDVVGAVMAAARTTTTDGTNTVVVRPGGIYVDVWIRDYAMTAAAIPEYFTAAELLAFYQWYKAGVKLDTYEVPDHIGLNGVRYYKPGGDDSVPWAGSRATADGGPFLIREFWAYISKSGDTAAFLAERDFLLALLEEGLTYSPAGCVYVDPAAHFFQWGFQDSVIATGSVLFCSVLAFIAYRQLAEMAFDAGDYSTARYCITRSEAVRAGVETELWDNTISFYKLATGVSQGPDVWGSALAVDCGLASDEHARRISVNLASAYGVTTGGKPELYYKGGVRTGLRSRDHDPNVKLFMGSIVSPGISDFDTYQNGAYWNTPIAWVVRTIALTNGQIAASLAFDCYCEASFEGWAYLGRTDGGVANPSPAEWVSILTSEVKPGTVLPRLGAVNYATSAAALLSIRQGDCGPMPAAQTILTVSGAAGPQPFPDGAFVKLVYDQVVRDEMSAADLARFGIVAPFTGMYQVEFIREIAAIGATVRVTAAPNINGERAENRSSVVPGGFGFSLGAAGMIGAVKGVLISADGQINGPDGTGPYPGAYIPQQSGDANSYSYSYLRVTYRGDVGA